MKNAGEPVLVCPYNKAHSIIKSRMQFHLVKCRAQSGNSEKVVCPYDSTHIVPKLELEFHQQICQKRIVIDSFIYNVGHYVCAAEPVPVNVPEQELAPCDENWDEEPKVSVLESIKEEAKEKKVLLNLIGAPKAERKAHRVQERLRFQRVADTKEPEKKSSNNERIKKEVKEEDDDDDEKEEVPSENENTSLAEKSTATSSQELGANFVEGLSQESTKLPEQTDSVTFEEYHKDTSKRDTENDFEVVKSHKKNHGKKQKKNQQQILSLQQPQQQVRRPPSNNNMQVTRAEAEDALNKMTKLSFDRSGNNHQQSVSSSSATSSLRTDVKLTKNAWDKPLNMMGHGIMPERPIFEDFPSLPVSGRGRGLASKRLHE